MDDNSFCAVCHRQILPKRILVPVYPDPAPADSPRTKKQQQRSGLVNGTGRVRPNGTIKPVKTRVEIDQSPAPLYCSADCRLRDSPDSQQTYCASISDDDEDVLRTAPPPRPVRSTPNTRSLAVLQREIGLAALPPSTSETYDELCPRAPPAPYVPPPYTSGVMMAARRIEAILPKPLAPGERPPPLAPTLGWTDGSQAWRAHVYSFAAPPQSRADVIDPNRAAYQSCVASPHRSNAGVMAESTSSSSSSGSTSSFSSSSPRSAASSSSLLSSFEDSFARRTSSRLSSPASSCASSPPRKLSHIAACNLLLPEVMRHPKSESTPTTRSTRRHSSGSFGAGRMVRSPLSKSSSAVSRNSDDTEEDEEEAAYVKSCGGEFETPTRPNIETRSWSYDNVRTYPVMVMPPLKEKHLENGVEVEVEVSRQRRRLFTFEPIPIARDIGAF
ncbi:hypothetical protein R3P38DRAFT_1867416 [Favolaschia claudopus]|uniref:Uncharacterized protein n=1 Tax=Favolaschia claudopus TaxID=2862362 RepID=A0AAW0DBG8_9AGAR